MAIDKTFREVGWNRQSSIEYRLFIVPTAFNIHSEYSKISNLELPLLRWTVCPTHYTIYDITRPISFRRLWVTSGPSSWIDDSGNPPSKTRYEATNARLIYRLQSPMHSPAKLLGISRYNYGSTDIAAHIRHNVFCDIKLGRLLRPHSVQHTDTPWCR